jgi:hypothetical protein
MPTGGRQLSLTRESPQTAARPVTGGFTGCILPVFRTTAGSKAVRDAGIPVSVSCSIVLYSK